MIITKILQCSFFKFFFLILFILERGGGKEKETSMSETLMSCFLHSPNQGPGLQPRRVP